MKFCTILHNLKSPMNVGMIIRSHAAFSGHELIFTGQPWPWKFKKGTQNFSHKLEKEINLKHIEDPLECLKHVRKMGYKPIAIEISEKKIFIEDFKFPDKTALVLGNEGSGLPKEFLEQCDEIVTIPQYSEVGSLNVAVSASIAMHEVMKAQPPSCIVKDEYI